MPVKPDLNSKHLQLIISNGGKFHQTFTVIIKNSNVLIQPTSSEYLHITMHPKKGTKKRMNSHLRIENESVKRFEIKSADIIKIKNGKLIQWNRKILPSYDSPLEFIFPACYIKSYKADLKTDLNTQMISYNKGALKMNFWFTTSNKETLERYWNNSGLKILMFERIEKTNENFALTYHIEESDESYKNMVKANDYFQVGINEKEGSSTQPRDEFSITFGLSPPHKKSIIFH